MGLADRNEWTKENKESLFGKDEALASPVVRGVICHDDYWQDTPNDFWGQERRCKHCGAGDDAHHSFTCPTNMHPDKRENGI